MTEATHRVVVACVAVLGLALAGPASGQTVLYKLIGRDGKVTYSDKPPPKDYDGRVIRIEPDTESNLLPFGKERDGAKAAPDPARPGIAVERRRTREALEEKLRAAREKVEAARKAKDAGADPQPDETQVVQRRFAPLRPGQTPPFVNCFNSVDPHGAASLVCPTQVPQEAFFERQKKLDEALRRAEAELEEAERNYRRGTD